MRHFVGGNRCTMLPLFVDDAVKGKCILSKETGATLSFKNTCWLVWNKRFREDKNIQEQYRRRLGKTKSHTADTRHVEWKDRASWQEGNTVSESRTSLGPPQRVTKPLYKLHFPVLNLCHPSFPIDCLSDMALYRNV